MSVTRTLVTTLLVGSIIIGFLQGLSTQTASGVITSYSTMTSVYYSTWHGTTTSTTLSTTTAKTATQGTIGATWQSGQIKQEGPYLRLEITFYAWYERGVEILFGYYVDGSVTNLMNVAIEKASVVMKTSNRAESVVDEASLDFESIAAGGTAKFAQKELPVKKTFKREDAFLSLVRTVIVYKDRVNVEATIAYTLAVTRTNTYATTGTITYTISEIRDFLGSSGGILVAVAAIAVILIVAAFVIRGKSRAQAKKEETPARLATKACVKCGFQLSVDADYCSECGQKLT